MKQYAGPAILMAAIGVITLGATLSSSSNTSGTSCKFDKSTCHYFNKNQKIYDNMQLLIRAERDRDLKSCQLESSDDQYIRACWERHGWERLGGPNFMSEYNNVVRPKIARRWTGDKKWLREQFEMDDINTGTH